jgi:hypothetical protein
LASAQYAKDKLIRLPELKIEYNPKEKNSQNVHSYGRLKIFERTCEGRSTATIWSKKCKMLDGKDQKRAEETTGNRKAMKYYQQRPKVPTD